MLGTPSVMALRSFCSCSSSVSACLSAGADATHFVHQRLRVFTARLGLAYGLGFGIALVLALLRQHLDLLRFSSRLVMVATSSVNPRRASCLAVLSRLVRNSFGSSMVACFVKYIV